MIGVVFFVLLENSLKADALFRFTYLTDVGSTTVCYGNKDL